MSRQPADRDEIRLHSGLMVEDPSRDRPTYATRLLQAFAEVLEDSGELSTLLDTMLRTVGDRVLVEVANQALVTAVEFTNDPDLGLRAARRLVLGDVGAVDYVVSSAPTVKDALDDAARYMRLVNDVLTVHLVLDGASAIVRLDSHVVLPRAAVDFAVGGFFRNHVHEWLSDDLAQVTVRFAHPAPSNLTEYLRTFGPAELEFNAPLVGFEFPRRFLDAPLKNADPNLHAVMVPYVEQALGQMAPTGSVTANVRKLIVEGIEHGGPDIAGVSAELGMSMRTLARRLESEGTSFRDLLDEHRRRLALDLVGGRDTDLSVIASRLGFSHTAPFYRAFRRWTGLTPLGYRRSRGR